MAGSFFSSTSSTSPTINPAFLPVYQQAFGPYEQFQATAPNLTALYQNYPQLNVPGIDPTQQNVLNQLVQTGQNNPEIQAALAQLQQLTSGPIGSSPATQAGMQAFQQLEAPIIGQQSALRGTAGGGQAIEALGQGATAAALPLIQTEIANRQAAVQQYGQLGQQQMQQLALALEASGLPREIALEQAQAIMQRQMGQQQMAFGLQTLPLDLLGSISIGQQGTSTPSGLDITKNITGGLASILGSIMAGAA